MKAWVAMKYMEEGGMVRTGCYAYRIYNGCVQYKDLNKCGMDWEETLTGLQYFYNVGVCGGGWEKYIDERELLTNNPIKLAQALAAMVNAYEQNHFVELDEVRTILGMEKR